MPKLDPHNQIHATQDTIAQILNLYDVSDFTFTFPNDGISNTTLIIKTSDKKHVLRVYAQERKTNEEILLEIEFQDYLRSNGIPIPVIYKNKEGKELSILKIDEKDWQCLLMECIEGQNVTVNPSKELVIQLAHLQAKMHLLGIEFTKSKNISKYLWLHLSDSLAGKIGNIHVLKNNEEVTKFIERVKSYKYDMNPDLPYGFNHLDVDFDGNIITYENKIVGIIDFDDLRSSPPIVCLGYTLWNILDDNGLEDMKFYLKEYEKVRPLTPLEYETLPHVIFFRNYVIGIIRLMLWEEDTPMEDITDILRLEKEILGVLPGKIK